MSAQVGNSDKSVDPTLITDKNKQTVSVYSFFSTVASKKDFFSHLEIEGVDKARILQSRLGWLSDQQFKEAIQDNLVMNADITVDDIHCTEAIYGKAVTIIKGKNENAPSMSVMCPRFKFLRHCSSIIPLHHPTDELDINFLCIQGAPYLLSKTQKVKFQSVR